MSSDIDQPHYQDGKLQSLIPMQHHVDMADPGLRGYLYTEAERAMGNLFEKGCISAAGHAEILRILRMEHGGGQQTGYPVQQSFPMPLQNAYPQQNAYQVQPPKYETVSYPAPQNYPPPQQQPPPPQPQPQPEPPKPEKHHSAVGDFGKRMGNNVVNGISSGFGLTLGSDMANDLWHKL